MGALTPITLLGTEGSDPGLRGQLQLLLRGGASSGLGMFIGEVLCNSTETYSSFLQCTLFPVLTSAILAFLQEPMWDFSYWSDCKPRCPTRSRRNQETHSHLCPAETLSLHCQESDGDWEDPEPQPQAIPISNQGFAGAAIGANHVCLPQLLVLVSSREHSKGLNTLLLFPFIHQGNFKSLPVRWLCRQAVKYKLQIRGGQYPFHVLMLEGR